MVGFTYTGIFLTKAEQQISNEENKKHQILVHGWLSATLDLLFHTCLLALSPSGRHGRIAAAVCTCCCCHYGVLAVHIAVGCGVATSAALVHEETEETYT